MDLTFRTKLLLSTCALVLLTGALVIVVSDRGNHESTRLLVNSVFREVSGHAVTQTRAFVLRAAPIAESLGQLADHGLALDDPEKLAPQLLAFLKGNAGMTRVLYADESGRYTGATRMHDGALHVERRRIADDGKTHIVEYAVGGDGKWTVVHEGDDRAYDPRGRPFYLLAKERGELAWTPPYMFFSEGVPGISCVVPVKRAEGVEGAGGGLRGVFSVEFDLNALSQFVAALSISENSRVFLFTPDQMLLAHANQRRGAGATHKDAMGATGPAKRGEMLTLADTGDSLVDAFRQHLEPGSLDDGGGVAGGGGGGFRFFEFTEGGVGYMASTTVFPIGDRQRWVVGAVAPQSDFLAAVWRTRWMSLAAACAALGIAALLAGAMSRRISRPIQSLIGFMERVGAGDLDAKADFKGGREFRHLSDTLNQMIGDLRERLHLRHSLAIAMEVQKSLLPAGDPVSPLLDIAGRSKYCDETGGDYYDFINVSTVTPSALMVAVGDVTGHGIPSALVMATARAALRTSALGKHSLCELMTRTNEVLSSDNRHNRFMTLSLLLIEAETRVVRWASAGHDPAIVFSPDAGSFRELEGGDLPLGIVEGTQYEEYTSDPLPIDSVLVIGTDGIWEMFNEQKAQYGKPRLQEVMRANHHRTAAEIAAALEADLVAFRGLETPADDVTFVVVKFVGAGV